MLNTIARRLGESLLVLLIMSFLIYALIGLMPGDPIDLMIQANPNLTAEDAQRLRALHGLDRPLSERYLVWLGGAVQGDFGFSRIHTRPVVEVLAPRLWNTVVLMGLSFALALALALPLGMWAAARPRGLVDHAINFLAFAGISVPPFWLAILLIMLFAVALGWLPAGGMGEAGDLASRLRHLALPTLTLTLLTAGGIIRFMRASMMEALRQDYIRTGFAKGLSERRG
jgi:peptide/nickel transport system permease protein